MYIFLTIGIIFLFLDYKKNSRLTLALACSFLFCAIVAYKIPHNYLIQSFSLLLFFGVFFFLISIVFNKEKKDHLKLKNLGDIINKEAIVIKDIGRSLSIDGIGLVEYKKEHYSAKSTDDSLIPKGSVVRIVSRENLILNVKAK